MPYQNTMPATGKAAIEAESSRRAMETLHAKPSEVVTFRAATQMQVTNALREEELHGVNASVHLARQGLYNPDWDDEILHPRNVSTIVRMLQETEFVAGTDTYELLRETYDKVIGVLENKPGLLYVPRFKEEDDKKTIN